jgi:spermidine/putrescine transport system substrate-binding protein
MLTRSDLKGKVTLLSEMQDTMIFMLLLEGADPSDFSDEEWDAALGRLEEAKESGQVRQFSGNSYINDLARATSWLARRVR